jgi:hypothetical protein
MQDAVRTEANVTTESRNGRVIGQFGVRRTNRVVSVGASRMILAFLWRRRACGNSLLD